MPTTTALSTSFNSDIHSDIQHAHELSLSELDNVNGGNIGLAIGVAIAVYLYAEYVRDREISEAGL